MTDKLTLPSEKSNVENRDNISRWWAFGALGLTLVGLSPLGFVISLLGLRRTRQGQCSPGRRKLFLAATIISSTGLILELALVIIFLGPWIRWGLQMRGAPKTIYGKCTGCGFIQTWSYWEVAFRFPFKYIKDVGSLPRTCPQCRQETLRFSLKCPKCSTVYNPRQVCGSMYDDKCPNCKESYAKAWHEKYRK
jgi:hypothetical protein